MTVVDEIARLAELHRAKQAEYGATDVSSGAVFVALFPDGVRLETRADFARFKKQWKDGTRSREATSARLKEEWRSGVRR